jgi:2-polyprenyl-3-methyl-5-hydroxy-6-metoxy-1,4-benzoquinol methylase
MPSFRNRSYEKELLDRNDIPFQEIKQNMKELDKINSLLGGHRCTLLGLKRMLSAELIKKNEIHITEIGSGGGDNLRIIRNWCLRNNIRFNLTGIDINPECIRYAQNLPENTNIQFICSDYKEVQFADKPDIIFSSLFCHHFTEEQLAFMLRWMQRNAEIGFFINDLHRHVLAFYSIKFLTQLFSRSRLVKNDAPLSVQRGFIRRDWTNIFNMAGISSFKCKWNWAFRWLITSHHE